MRLEGSTTDKETINIRLSNEFNAVQISDGTTIDNSGLLSNLSRDIRSEVRSNERMNFLSLSGSSDLTGTNSPDRLVGKNNGVPLFKWELSCLDERKKKT